VKNKRTQSALLVAGAAAGAVAATWLGRRRLRAMPAPTNDLLEPDVIEAARAPLLQPEGSDAAERVSADILGPARAHLVEPDSAELPLGRSADPDIDRTLSRRHLPQDDTSGGALFGDVEPRPEREPSDASLDEVWNAMPGLVGAEQTEGYDAVEPEDLGAVWLERATQTTHEQRPQASDPNDVPDLDALLVSEASRTSALSLDDDELDKLDDDKLDKLDDDELDDDELDDENAIAEDALDIEDDAPDRKNR
jgi:hypothetical protein